MAKCGNCYYVFDQKSKTYTGTWIGSLGPNDKDYSKYTAAKYSGVGVASTPLEACKRAANNVCQRRYNGKSCTTIPPIPCKFPDTPTTTTPVNTKSGDLVCDWLYWVPFVGIDCYKKQTNAKLDETRKKYPNINDSPDCKKECGNYFTDFGCYYHKWALGCPGSLTFNDVIGDGKADSLNKEEICAKHCEMFDIFCKSAKVQAGCGGTDSTLLLLGGGALLVLLLVLMK